MFKASSPLFSGLLWYAPSLRCSLCSGSSPLSFSTTIKHTTNGSERTGRSHGVFHNPRKHGNGSVYALLTAWSTPSAPPCDETARAQKPSIGGMRKCLGRKRCCPRTSIRCSIRRKRPIGRVFTVRLSQHCHYWPLCEGIYKDADNSFLELPKWTRVSQRLNPPGF